MCGHLCRCHAQDGDLHQAATYCNQNYEISRELQLRCEELSASLDMGIVLRLTLRADRRGQASLGQASTAPHTLSSLPECMEGRIQEADRWLRIALEGGKQNARLQLSYLAFDSGLEEEALAHLKLYLAKCVKQGRDECRGCFQVRGEDAQMLTCSGKCAWCTMCAIDDLHLFMIVRTLTCIRFGTLQAAA